MMTMSLLYMHMHLRACASACQGNMTAQRHRCVNLEGLSRQMIAQSSVRRQRRGKIDEIGPAINCPATTELQVDVRIKTSRNSLTSLQTRMEACGSYRVLS